MNSVLKEEEEREKKRIKSIVTRAILQLQNYNWNAVGMQWTQLLFIVIAFHLSYNACSRVHLRELYPNRITIVILQLQSNSSDYAFHFLLIYVQ